MQLSLAGWSLNKLFRDASAPLKLVDFPAFARDRFDIEAVELNNIYFESTLPAYLDALRDAARAAGSTLLNIAVDEQGDVASRDPVARHIAVANNARWVPVAKYLGCDAVRVNSGGRDIGDAADRERAIACAVDSFRRLCDVGCTWGVKILIENHWGLSSDPAVMTRVCREVDASHGRGVMYTLADWGNWPDDVDRYAALEQVMPFAGAVHAKVNDIDEKLNHPRFDHARCLKIARDAGYDGHLGIEYEGKDDPVTGVTRGAMLLRKLLAG